MGGRSSKLALVALRAKHPDEPLLALVSRITGEPMVPGTRRVSDARVDLQRQLDTM